MVFSSEIFIFFFLPIVLAGYYIVPPKFRNALLLFFSFFIFYAWDKPYYALIMAVVTTLNYFAGRLIGISTDEKKRKIYLVLSVALSLLTLGFFKYTNLFIGTLGDILGKNFALLELALPIGISFYTFQTMSYTIDVYRKNCEVCLNFVDFSCYVTMFPQLIAGPIVRYVDVEKDLLKLRRFDTDKFTYGAMRFITGLSKKVILANSLGALSDEIFAMSSRPVLTAWLGAVAFTFRIYYDFSGYSDMAIGMGKMLGFNFPENFNFPYAAKSITEFWRRWHITLGTWFREYLYIPLGGNRVGKLHLAINLLIVWGLTGLWHGAEWNFLLWGLYFGIILIVEKLFLLKYLEKLPKFLQRIYALFLIVIGWVIFNVTDISSMAAYFSDMFSGRLFDATTGYYLLSNAVLLIISAVFSVDTAGKLGFKSTKVTRPICRLILIILFIVSIAYLVGGTYNPFLYFRF